MAIITRMLVVLCLSLFGQIATATTLNSVAFYYGPKPPVAQLRAYQVVVVDPYTRFNPKNFNTPASQAFAYVSVGEAEKNQPYYHKLSKRWFLGKNTIWNTQVINQANSDWRRFFVNHIITPLWQKGYRGFFLDTLDSYQLVAKTARAQKAQIAGLVKLVRAIKKRYPTAKLIFNRGFELLPKVKKDVYALAAESLYNSWHEQDKRYTEVSLQDRTWLLKKLEQVKAMGLPVIVIDYVSPQNQAKREQVVKQISQHGFIPWVTDGSLTQMGSGAIKVMPRQILVVYDNPQHLALPQTSSFRTTAMILEYLGYKPVYENVEQALKTIITKGEYAGVVTWLNDVNSDQQQSNNKKISAWLLNITQQHIPLLILNQFPFALHSKLFNQFGLQVGAKIATHQPLKVAKAASMIGFESMPSVNSHDFIPIKLLQGKSLLRLKNTAGQIGDVIALTPWGGYAIAPYFITQLPNGQQRWVINPVEFFKRALKLPLMPIPDTTTENGRRLMMVHIDGDGFVSKAEWHNGPLAGEVIEKQILEHYKVPTTVSIVEGEISPLGILPQRSFKAMEIARQIFKLPWVEIATHSYSHPFDWQRIEQNNSQKGLNLPIPKYDYNVNREIKGSVAFIDHQLAPRDKKTKVMLWTGHANPTKKALAASYKANLRNLNGGDTVITNANSSLLNISPMGYDNGGLYQVFAPIQNENIFTNEWTGPFYGFQNVIQTFKLTDGIYRFKPIDIYYHFYSGSKKPSLLALNRVYQWALAQKVMNIYISEYVDKVLDFNQVAIAQQNGGWLIHTDGALREFRIASRAGVPDLLKSKNVIGFSRHNQETYIHLGPGATTFIKLTHTPKKLPYIVTANATVRVFKRQNKDIELAFKGYMPISFTLANMRGCQLMRKHHVIQGVPGKAGTMDYHLADTTSHVLKIVCQQTATHA